MSWRGLFVLSALQAIEAHRSEFERVLHQVEKEMKRVTKAESKLQLLTAGFEKRAASAVETVQKAASEMDEKCV